ncbi:MAG: sulfite dehydrogenase [Gemmatimonadales bacterium]
MSLDPTPPQNKKSITRRALLATAAGTLGATVLPATRDASAEPAAMQRGGVKDTTKIQGHPARSVGQRAPAETPQRLTYGNPPRGSLTPLQDLRGITTPADLHFERHHGGVPQIDPQNYSLLIHGMVERPMIFTLDDLKRFPPESRFHFLECSGNGSSGYIGLGPERTPQQIDGLTSNSEWTGVPLATLFTEVGASPDASWFLAEGADAAVMTRSIPVEKAFDDAMIAYGQNGEAIRPEQGYPARLLLPGWEGNSNVKWIRRIELADAPFMTRDETSKYTDPLADGTARQFSFVMDAKSIITFPAYPAKLPERGYWEITGIAWTGRGKITRVEVSTDGGDTWQQAELQQPVLPKCHTRFRLLWNWQGEDALLLSRAVDETGYVQPTVQQLREARGPATHYHYNNIRAWKVAGDGNVTFGLED